MKTAALRKLRQNLAAGNPVHGLWVTLESPSITEMAVALGYDWIVIDAEHGHLDWKEIVDHLRATIRSETVALVRIAELNGGLIKRALDIGADGVVVPWIETVEQLQQAVSFARYPPQGVRGIGGERATCWGHCMEEHTAEANENVLVVPIIETVRSVAQLPRMSQVDGVEVFLFGPADYSSTAGFRGQWEGPGVAEQILQMKDTLRRAGKSCGVMATSHDNLRLRQQQGFQMIAVGLDAGLLYRELKAASTLFGPAPAKGTAAQPLARPPESMRPDRQETMSTIGSGVRIEISRGVNFECLVGSHNGARGLTTGWVTFSPGATLPYHSHTFSESITLIRGSAMVEVEGRGYLLKEMDNVTIPVGLAHSARNLSTHQEAVFQIAMATDSPKRTLVDRFFSRRMMPPNSTGIPQAERVVRFATAERTTAGPNTEFIDFFNETLMPGMEMSGGYGLFQPQGRLPAHVHDFDESICIVSGLATCIVEGRRYSMSDGATAMQPRGRVHYFVNETKGLMEMLWVYAGPKPDRIVVDERCATVEGNPWR